MMSVNGYYEHYKNQKQFVIQHRMGTYWVGNSEYNEIEKNMNLALLNLCKMLLVYNSISFKEQPEEGIIRFVASFPNYADYIHSVKLSMEHWESATRRKTSRYYYLDNVVEALQNFEKLLVFECKLGG